MFITMVAGGFIKMNVKILSQNLPVLYVMAFLCTACTPSSQPELRGFNFLQHSHAAFDSEAACRSLEQLKDTGANSIVLVPFLEQDDPQSTQVRFSHAVTDEQVIAAIKIASRYNLHRILKPQLLIKDSWAGAVRQEDPDQEAAWFKSYEKHLLHYARIAETYGVEALVIGTELEGLRGSTHWPTLIRKVRSVFSGKLTYAANGVEGVESFLYWNLLDHIGVTLYPDLSNDLIESDNKITYSIVDQLQRLAEKNHRSVWILEVGIPSAKGWEAHPWDWRRLASTSPLPDQKIQAKIIHQWLTASAKPGINGIWIWQWTSLPEAGGENDISYTVQNKITQKIVQQLWQTPVTLLAGMFRECTI